MANWTTLSQERRPFRLIKVFEVVIGLAAFPNDSTETVLGTIEVKHSFECVTSWVRVINTLEGATVSKLIERQPGAGLPEFKNEYRDRSDNFEV